MRRFVPAPQLKPLGFVVPMASQPETFADSEIPILDNTPAIIMALVDELRSRAERRPILGIRRKPRKDLSEMADIYEKVLLEMSGAIT